MNWGNMPQTKFPKTIKIGSKKYKLVFVEEVLFDDENLKKVNEAVVGFCDTTNSNIYISSQIADPFELHSTVFHECIHGISDYAGIDLTENQVIALSHAILDMFLTNKELTKKLLTIN